MRHDANKTREALINIRSLIEDISFGYFIPKKFRKSPFTSALRDKYLSYLLDEAKQLEAKLGIDKPKVIRPVEEVSTNE